MLIIRKTPIEQRELRKKLHTLLRTIGPYNIRNIGVLKRALAERELGDVLARLSLDGSLLRDIFHSQRTKISTKALLIKYYNKIHRLITAPVNFSSWNQ